MKPHCLNCNSHANNSGTYCSNCGQKLDLTSFTLWHLILDSLADFFDFDSKLLKSMRALWRPGFLTKEFMAGRRKSYVNPLRLYLSMTILFFSLLLFWMNRSELDWKFNDLDERVSISRQLEHFDSLAIVYQLPVDQKDSIRLKLFGGVKLPQEDTFSFLKLQTFTFFGFHLEEMKVLNSEVVEMPIEAILDKYKISGFWKRLVYKQALRISKDIEGVTKFLIGNLFWGVLLAAFFIGLLKKILYIRHDMYFIEHFVFWSHLQSFVFLVGFISVLLEQFNIPILSQIVSISIPLLLIPYSIMAYKTYYQQSWIKTLGKMLIIGMSYIIILFSLLFFVSLISLLLF